MRRVVSTQGYTILETMIFLAVSGLLFASAATLISGQQRKAEFQQGIRDFESQIQDIANDVSTGYYATNNDFTCTGNLGSGPPVISTAAITGRGTNVGCIFVGRALHFSPNDVNANANTFDVYPVAGNKQVSIGAAPAKESETLGDAHPVTIDTKKERLTIPGGITVGWVKHTDTAGTEQPAGGFGIFTTFGKVKADGTDRLQGGTINVNVLPIANDINQLPNTFEDAVKLVTDANIVMTKGDVKICLQSAGTKQHVILRLAGGNRKFGTETTFGTGATCP